jgi:hypothetical protein
MDETNSNPLDAWLGARVGNAIDVWVDRTLNRPQFTNDPSQAYGVDGNGNLYQLGQTNGQIVAQVNTGRPVNSGMNSLLIIGLIALVVMGAK